ncbi:MAG: hypothetical protein M0R06_22115 [Sphaerochaeta sp.]|jgi:hypothetical protein|nr:hypothetical protein [Sphaerochaeta sp.]
MTTTFRELANNWEGTLEGRITAVATEMVLKTGDEAGLPTTPYYFSLDSEIVKVTAAILDVPSGIITYTIERAQEDTVATSHEDGCKVSINVTKGAIEDAYTAINAIEDDYLTSSHTADEDAHHAKYTDAEALAAAKAGTGISDDDLVQIDDAAVADDDFCRFTANGIEGLAKADMLSALNVADGADVTGSNAPQAHKDSHDPEDGGDPLDTAAPSEIASVQAAGAGSSHSLARADHQHQIQHSIADNHIVTVDGEPADDEFARWTASGLEGLTVAESLTALFASAFPEDVGHILDASISADGKYSPVFMFAGTAGAALSFGQVVYFASADSKWELTDADAEATTKPRIAIVVSGAAEDAAIVLMGMGYIRKDDWDWSTPGAPLFLDTTTAGGLTETAPSGTGDCIRVAGYVVDANTIFFNPSNDWYEHA